ncbi:MAG: branched-chain amino acid ABC transporter permease [bacterium]
MRYVLSVATLVAIYGILAIALNLVLGYSGMLALNFGALLGIGAFAFGILAEAELSTDLVVTIGVAMIAAAFISVTMGLPSLRLHGVYFMIASFAVQLIMVDVFFNYTNTIHGQSAIFGYGRPTILGAEVSSPEVYTALSWILLVLVALLSWRLVASPFGVALRGIRDNESAVLASGRSVRYFKVAVFAIGGMLAALAGVLYAGTIGVVAPEDFGLNQSIALIAMVVFGGAGSLLGPILGAALLVVIPQAIQYVQVGADAAHVQQFLFGAILVVLMMIRRRGLVGEGL